MIKIDKNNPTPLYLQIEELIREKIENGILKPGNLLPPEKKLKEEFNVSRTTIRQAMEDLSQEGIITRIQGKGTYVTNNDRTEPNLSSLNSFTEELKKEGKKPGSKVLELSLIKTPKYISKQLNTKENKKIIYYKRLRTSDDKPVAIHTVYLNPEYLPGLKLQYLNKNNISLYEVIENKLNIEIGTAEEVLKAISADKNLSQILNIPVGSPIMSLTRITSTINKNRFEYAKIVAKGDEFQYKAKLKRNNNL